MHAPPLINVKELTFQNPIVYFFADPSQKVSRPPFGNAVTLLPFDDFCRVPNVKAVMKIWPEQEHDPFLFLNEFTSERSNPHRSYHIFLLQEAKESPRVLI